MTLQILLITATFIIAIIGYIKSEKYRKLILTIAIPLLILSVIFQVIIVVKENEEKIKRDDKLAALTDKGSALLSKIENYQVHLQEQDESVEILQKYGEISKYNIFGEPFSAGAGLKITTGISKIMKDALIEIEDKVYCNCNNEEALSKYKQLVLKYPLFPFSYYCLAQCLKSKGDSEWKSNALKAIEILQKTTKVEGHNWMHDQALEALQTELNK